MFAETETGVGGAESGESDELREWARRHVERIRKLKRDLAVFVAAVAVLTPVWALIEWNDHGRFERLSNGNNPGDWEPWVLYVVLVWGFFLALDAIRALFDRPTTDAEIERTIRRLDPNAR